MNQISLVIFIFSQGISDNLAVEVRLWAGRARVSPLLPREGVCAGGALTTALCSTRAFTSSTFPEITLGRMEESAPLQNRKMSPVLPQKGGGEGGSKQTGEPDPQSEL